MIVPYLVNLLSFDDIGHLINSLHFPFSMDNREFRLSSVEKAHLSFLTTPTLKRPSMQHTSDSS